MTNSQNEVVFLEPGTAPEFVLKGIRIKKTSFHKEAEELYFVIAGRGVARLGDKNYELQAGCFFRVPAKTLHEFSAHSEGLDLLNFHSPPVFPDHDTYFPDNPGST
jgi:mannose-6-phosphate isomerase-like protein (cupin superfamily)